MDSSDTSANANNANAESTAVSATLDAKALSRMAHDLRNPLNSISMNAELVKLKLQRGESREEVIDHIDRILRECKNCGSVLEASIKDAGE